MLCENIANVPMIVFPRINAANARQPAWSDHLNRLRSVGVERISGDDVWPLAEPRATGPRELPRSAIIDAVLSADSGSCQSRASHSSRGALPLQHQTGLCWGMHVTIDEQPS